MVKLNPTHAPRASCMLGHTWTPVGPKLMYVYTFVLLKHTWTWAPQVVARMTNEILEAVDHGNLCKNSKYVTCYFNLIHCSAAMGV